mmetsp:Transcript_22560/g.38556  ORF Transcript_22560/g.38556 Transcript_22560/m.38556 type:complete len:223 (+) Transcript_22560:36-704(+)
MNIETNTSEDNEEFPHFENIQSFSIKVKYGEKIRIIPCQSNYESILQKIEDVFERYASTVKLYYKDDDNDCILMSKQSDFELAMYFHLKEKDITDPLFLILKDNDRKPKPSSNYQLARLLEIKLQKRFYQTGERITQDIEYCNFGSIPWLDDTEMVLTKESKAYFSEYIKPVHVGAVAPGDTKVIRLEFNAPNTPGIHTLHWRLRSQGSFFGHRCKLDISVR